MAQRKRRKKMCGCHSNFSLTLFYLYLEITSFITNQFMGGSRYHTENG